MVSLPKAGREDPNELPFSNGPHEVDTTPMLLVPDFSQFGASVLVPVLGSADPGKVPYE
jgi:hypothetical protein